LENQAIARQGSGVGDQAVDAVDLAEETEAQRHGQDQEQPADRVLRPPGREEDPHHGGHADHRHLEQYVRQPPSRRP